MTVQEKRYTVEEFLAPVESPENPENADRRLEPVDGVITEMPPSSNKNTILAGLIITYLNYLNLFVLQRKIGCVTVPDGGFVIGPHSIFQPDVAYLSKARAGSIEDKGFPVAPGLAVEVISPSKTVRQVMNRVRAYLRAGTQIVWAVYPEDKVIDVHCLGQDDGLITHTLTIADTLTGGTLLPEFRLPLADLFGPLEPPAPETTQA